MRLPRSWRAPYQRQQAADSNAASLPENLFHAIVNPEEAN